MEHHVADQFLVFLRTHSEGDTHEVVEVPLGEYDTYADARRAQLEQQRAARDCVIRYVGPSGGGD
jgi:hypothetical protein